MTSLYFTNSTAMLLDAREWAQRYNARVIDPDTRVELAEACADIQFQAKVVRAYGDLRGQVFADVCADVLGPGFARLGTAVALQRSTGGQPVSHVVNVAAGGLMVIFATCLYTGTGPGSLAISFGISPREISRMASSGRSIISRLGRSIWSRASSGRNPDQKGPETPRQGLKSKINRTISPIKTQPNTDQNVFPALSDMPDPNDCCPILSKDEGPPKKKRKVSPEGDEDNMRPSRPSKMLKKCRSTSVREEKERKVREESTSRSIRKQPTIVEEEKINEGADKSATSYDDTLTKEDIALDSPQRCPLDPAYPQRDFESASTYD